MSSQSTSVTRGESINMRKETNVIAGDSRLRNLGTHSNRCVKQGFFGGVALLAGLACLPGCEPATAVPAVHPPPAPMPEGAKDDPRVADSRSTGDAVGASLAIIHDRLENMATSFNSKVGVEGDLKDVAAQLQPMIASARTDCEAIRRAARDLKVQLPIAQAGYVNAAASYRQRAEGYQDPNLKSMTLGFAGQFDSLAADTPRRIGLTEKFLAQLDEAESFLAEADRCMRDAETALAVFSGGAGTPQTSNDTRGLALRLGQFILVVSEYHEALHKAPAVDAKGTPPVTGKHAETMPEPAPPRAASSRTPKASMSREQPGSIAAQVAFTRRVSRRVVPFPVGSRLEGEVSTPSHSFRNSVRLEILVRDGDSFAGVVHYAGGYAQGRRGVRGRVSPDGRGLRFAADWYEGNVSPGPIRYELTTSGGGLAGRWATRSLEGTINLTLPPG